MHLTTKGRFAVTAMLDLALHQESGIVALRAISSRNGISLVYLEQIFSKLRRMHLVKSFRGPQGGYRLAKSAKDINIADVISAVEESLDVTLCQGKGGCQKGFYQGIFCMTHTLWSTLGQKISEYLQSVSLADLVLQNKERRFINVNATPITL